MSWQWLLLALACLAAGSNRAKRYVAFRKGSTFFYRLNYKVNMLEYTTVFAQASGFKVGWQLPEAGIRRRTRAAGLSSHELRDAARLLYDSHGLDGQMCLMKSLCQSVQLLGKRDGVLAKILNLMAGANGANGANNASSLLDPLVCGNYANHCPLHLLGFDAFAQR